MPYVVCDTGFSALRTAVQAVARRCVRENEIPEKIQIIIAEAPHMCAAYQLQFVCWVSTGRKFYVPNVYIDAKNLQSRYKGQFEISLKEILAP